MDGVFKMEDGLLLMENVLFVVPLRAIVFFEMSEGYHGWMIGG